MAKRITQKELKHDEFVDAAFDFGHWIEEHWAKVALWVGAAVVAVVAVVLWNAWSHQQAERAKERLAQAIHRYDRAAAEGFVDRASLSAALETFEEIGGAGVRAPEMLARYYQGATLFHLDRPDEAKEELRAVVAELGPSDTLGATAQLLLARVQASTGHTDEAVSLLRALADQPASIVPPPQALLELGRIYRQAGRLDEAREQWQRIVEEYPDSAAAREARSLLG